MGCRISFSYFFTINKTHLYKNFSFWASNEIVSKILLFPVEHVEVTEEDFLSRKCPVQKIFNEVRKCPVQKNLSWREKMSGGKHRQKNRETM